MKENAESWKGELEARAQHAQDKAGPESPHAEFLEREEENHSIDDSNKEKLDALAEFAVRFKDAEDELKRMHEALEEGILNSDELHALSKKLAAFYDSLHSEH